MMSVLHGHISDSPTLNLYMWASSLLCPVLSLNRMTCFGLFSLCRLSDWFEFGCCCFHSFKRDKAAGCALGFMGLFCTGSLACAIDQGRTDGSANTSAHMKAKDGVLLVKWQVMLLVDYVLASTLARKQLDQRFGLSISDFQFGYSCSLPDLARQSASSFLLALSEQGFTGKRPCCAVTLEALCVGFQLFFG